MAYFYRVFLERESSEVPFHRGADGTRKTYRAVDSPVNPLPDFLLTTHYSLFSILNSQFFCCILAQVSRSETVRLKTSAPGFESFESTTK
jgi:hypothetical protein